MKKIFFFLFLFLFFLIAPTEEVKAFSSSPYTIENFDSKITLNQDTSLTVQEKITVYFSTPRHGIFRVIPFIYSSHGKNIRAFLQVVSVTDNAGQPYQYQVSRYRQSMKIKIGDPQKTVTGRHIYLIKYRIKGILLSLSDHEEIYWNVTGHEWDTLIKRATATVVSPYAPIKKVDCFAGAFGTHEKLCQKDFNQDEAFFQATTPLGEGGDFTIVVALDKNNQLRFPGFWEKLWFFLLGNWGYLAALLPLLIMFIFWYQKGRDQRYLSDNIYYQPESKATKKVPLFARKHLPLVYAPLDRLSPAQVGTIIDERVDMQDVVAEIVELARLGYLKIKKTEEKRLLGKKTDYIFVKENKDPRKLKDYQRYLLDSLFGISDAREVSLSSLKNRFYQCLPVFKKKLYQNLKEEGIFAGNPERIRNVWVTSGLVMAGVVFYILDILAHFYFSGPSILLIVTVPLIILLGRGMPRRTAWGYSLYRQIEGLRWFINKGKWREEIAEKHLFLEEILPLAIALGVVKKLAKDMAALGVEPPRYFQGVAMANFYNDWHSFSRSSMATLSSSPSGRSSWSGGSGFSGGSSGGGFGGGGGGSW